MQHDDDKDGRDIKSIATEICLNLHVMKRGQENKHCDDDQDDEQ